MTNALTAVRVLVRSAWWVCSGGARGKLRAAAVVYRTGGIRSCWKRAVELFGRENWASAYQDNQLSAGQSEFLLARCPKQPLFSIVVPVYKVKAKWLRKCIESVVRQHYGNWELVLVDDASGRADLNRLIDEWRLRDERIRLFALQENAGIAGATNFGIKHAEGEFIGFLDHDDELTPDALTWMTYTLNERPDALWLYSDEDRISPRGRCYGPHFKPDFSPEYLLANMFTCHFSVYATDVLIQSGGLREGFEGSQDHDLALRLSEIVPHEKLVHIPRVLYHWRVIPGSTARDVAAKPQAPISGRKAVREALERRNVKGAVTSHAVCPTLYRIEFEPSAAPRVSVIIPTGRTLDGLKRCIAAARTHTRYTNYEIVVVTAGSPDREDADGIEQDGAGPVRVLACNGPFSYSQMSNAAVASVESEFVVLMHDDVEIVSDGWLEQLLGVAELDERTGVVGGMLVYPDGTVQHGGMILGCSGGVGYVHRGIPSELSGYWGRLHALQEMSAVSAALALVRRSSYDRVGGFQADRYPASYSDVDLCIRLKEGGFRCIYNPSVRAVHGESDADEAESEEAVYRTRFADEHAAILKRDPFYNPNLGLESKPFLGYRRFPVEEEIPALAGMHEGGRDAGGFGVKEPIPQNARGQHAERNR